MKRDEKSPPAARPIMPWHRRPIGYEIVPDGAGFAAFMIHEGDHSAILSIASGRSERAVHRRAARVVRRQQRLFDLEHSRSSTRVIIDDPRREPHPPIWKGEQ